IVEHRSRRDANLSLTACASLDGFAALDAGEFLLAALGADRAIRPAQQFEVLTALDFAVETRHKSGKVKPRANSTSRRHGHAPMKKRKKKDREVLKELFPPEIVEEVDEILKEVDGLPRRENPTGKKAPRPWGRKWSEEQKRDV
ncbi:MAG: hypothetical protein WAL78_15875, partial [Candidatus Acidiferrales bacterium]